MATRKSELQIYLLEQGLSPEQIISLTLDNITKIGLQVDGKNVKLTGDNIRKFASLVEKAAPYLFPTKNGAQQTRTMFVQWLRTYCKQHNKTLKDFGIEQKRRTSSKPKLESMEDIFNYAQSKKTVK